MRQRLNRLLFVLGFLFLILAGSASAQSFGAQAAPASSNPTNNSFDTADTSAPAPVIGYDFYRPTNSVYCASNPSCASYLPEQFDPAAAEDSIYSSGSSNATTVPATTNGNYVYERGNARFIPSQFVDYQHALALGKKMLEQQANPPAQPSLGTIAASLRGNSNAANLKPASVSAVQSGNGQVVKAR